MIILSFLSILFTYIPNFNISVHCPRDYSIDQGNYNYTRMPFM